MEINEKMNALIDGSYYYIKVRLKSGSTKWILIMYIAHSFVDWSGIQYDRKDILDIDDEVESPEKKFSLKKFIGSWL